MNDSPGPDGPLTIAAQGSFAVGGAQISAPGAFDPRNQMDPAGQTLRGDHARVSYQIPVGARPLLLWHGRWEDGGWWDTIPDGREGFRTLFTRRRFAVYTLDQPVLRQFFPAATTSADPIRRRHGSGRGRARRRSRLPAVVDLVTRQRGIGSAHSQSVRH